ncbi:hypothetical protein GCM10010873_00190 [Cypionkella aquatica]|uniref:Uncharacterized protein n=1 Tax=Cypionkella aquatica TaxID=1756042 RepID=A0AA37U2D3_9RHOB|nr:hypothetical protein [Cypionkella aquatica]GLS85046.1 hypothetical protein GCM10010873_00190 [Cypionkella aquatica]
MARLTNCQQVMQQMMMPIVFIPLHSAEMLARQGRLCAGVGFASLWFDGTGDHGMLTAQTVQR